MSSYLVAESGSTKTDWFFYKKGKKPVFFKTPGINPYLQSSEAITTMLQKELPWDHKKHAIGKVSYYGAGAANTAQQEKLTGVLKSYFGAEKVTVQSDLLAAARALCGDEKGIVCILGTGSASCYYDGKKIKDRQPSLGYIAGDEGSGNHLGKKVLQYYTYGTFDPEMRLGFEMRFGKDIPAIVNKLYSEPYPNRYLATFVSLLKECRGHYMVENIIEDCLNDFFQHSILKYRHSWKNKLHFTGAVAHEFSDVIENLCSQYELELGKIEKSPLDGLVKYYKNK